ncbi:MAG: flippase-like domain-containing protein [Clostridiales bacterium]|nr:flippase-like domain-containing protein [Clostridiales bacterium]
MNLLRTKTILFGSVLLIALGGAALFVIHRELGGHSIIEAVKNADFKWLFIAFAFMIIYSVSDGLNIRSCLKLSGYTISFTQMMKYSYAGFFFSSITPSSSGGQPGQLFFMSRDKIRISHATFSLLSALLSFQVSAVIWGILGFFFIMHRDILPYGRFSFLFTAGFLLNLLIVTFLLIVLFFRKASDSLAGITIRLFRRISSKPGTKHRILRSFVTYRHASDLMKKNPPVLMTMLFRSFIQITLYHSISFLCLCSLGCTGPDWFTAVCVQGVLFMSVSSLPLPGASGITEYGYSLFYSDFIPSNKLGAAILLTRFMSFVLPLIISGLGLLIIQLKENIRRIRL